MCTKNQWQNYIQAKNEVYLNIMRQNYEKNLISEANWVIRSHYGSGEEIGLKVKPGDICFIDFGQSYLNEMGYQHFGLILAVYHKKALVIPMTSNEITYAKAYDAKDNPNGKKNLMRIGKIHKLVKPSVLFLNDFRFINTARVIDITTSISIRSALFKSIKERIQEILTTPNIEE